MNIYEINDKQKFSFSCIYLWKNLINGKLYVGQTQNFYQRAKQYQRNKEKNRIIGKAINKYGFDNFDISILEKDVPLDKLDEREQYWMDYYQSYDLNIGYNLCSEAGTTRGFKHSEETKQALSQNHKQFYIDHPEKIRRGKDNPAYGRHITPENSKKMSERLIGNQYAKGSHWVMSDETKEKISRAMKGKQNCLGRKLSAETKAKIAESNRRRIISETSKKKMSESHMGKTCRKVLCVETGKVYESIKDASIAVNVDGSTISKCCRGKQKTAGGFHWQYVDE